MGHKEFFLSLSKDGSGLWIRFLLSKKDEAVPSFSISYFDERGAHGEKRVYGRGEYVFTEDGPIIMGRNELDLNSNTLTGSLDAGKSEYKIGWSKKEDKINAVSGLERILDPRSNYTLLTPLAVFEGYIGHSGNQINVDGYKGMIGYISQPDYLRKWTWMHMSGSEEDPDMWADVLVTDIRLMGRNVSLLSARIDGNLIKTKLMPLTFEGKTYISGIHGDIKVKGENISVDAEAIPKKTIKVKYDAVKRYDAFCYNSEAADVSLRYHGRSFTSNSGFFEHGTRENIGGFTEINAERTGDGS
ncbi:MAG: hypothetical protein QXK90_04110 [Candidatus Parvarchaeota archaeon]